jgi:hypothetical protein
VSTEESLLPTENSTLASFQIEVTSAQTNAIDAVVIDGNFERQQIDSGKFEKAFTNEKGLHSFSD